MESRPSKILLFISTVFACTLRTKSSRWNANVYLNYHDPFLTNHTIFGNSVGLTDGPSFKFHHHAMLSNSGSVKLSWTFHSDEIALKLTAPTYGWIAFGIYKERSSVIGADFVLMGVNDQGSHLVDMHVNQHGRFKEDISQDVQKKYIWRGYEGTHGIFIRKFITCDEEEDVDITPDTVRVFWAYGMSTIDFSGSLPEEFNPQESGSMYLKFINPQPKDYDYDDELTRSQRMSMNVTADSVLITRGHYHFCKAFRFPDITEKHHITGFEPILDQRTAFNVRQIIIRECSSSLPVTTFDRQQTLDCEETMTTAECNTIVLVWSFSMKSFRFPPNVGYPVSSDNTHFLMEIQYKNNFTVALRDSSGMKINYTNVLREHDSGILTTGSLVQDSQLIPPKSSNFKIQGHCMNECIRMSIPEDNPVQIFSVTAYARDMGRKIRVRHFRNGKELTPVFRDNGFVSYLYETQFIPKTVELMKGDNMIVECTYDTSDRNEITMVNNSYGGESCLAYLGYYPRNVQLTACKTAPIENVTMATVGASRPDEIFKSAEKFEWTTQRIKLYNQKLLKSKIYVRCGDVEFEHPKPVPEIKEVYIQPSNCEASLTTNVDRKYISSTAMLTTEEKQLYTTSSSARSHRLISINTYAIFLLLIILI